MSHVEDRLALQVIDLEWKLREVTFWRDAFDRCLFDARRLLAYSDCHYAIAAQRRIAETIAAYDKYLNSQLGKENE